MGLRSVLVVSRRSAHASAVRDAILGAARAHARTELQRSPAEPEGGSGGPRPPEPALHAKRLLRWWESEAAPRLGRGEAAANGSM